MTVGHVTVGFSWSETATLKEQVPWLPDVSVTVYVTDVEPLANGDPLAWVGETDCTAQLSVELVGAKVTAAWQTPASVFVAMSPGQVMCGFSASTTVTAKVHDWFIAAASVAVTVT